MNSILFVNDAGRGETPPWPAAAFSRGDVVNVRNTKALAGFPRRAIVACVVPPGFPAAYALADMMGEPRPLMITKPLRGVSYILVNDGDPTPYLARETALRPTQEPRVEIGSIKRAAT